MPHQYLRAKLRFNVVANGGNSIVWNIPGNQITIPQGGNFDLNTVCTSLFGYPLHYLVMAGNWPSGVQIDIPTGIMSVSNVAPAGPYDNNQVMAADQFGGQAPSPLFRLTITTGTVVALGTWFEEQSVSIPRGGSVDITPQNPGGAGLTYSVLAALLDPETGAISSYTTGNVPPYLSMSSVGLLSASSSAPESANPYLLLKYRKSNGISFQDTTSAISVCIHSPNPVTFQAWTGDKDAGGTRVNSTDYTDASTCAAAAPDRGKIYATAGRYTGAPLVPQSNKVQEFLCLTGATGGRVLMDGDGRGTGVGRAFCNNGQAGNAPVDYTLKIRHVWGRHTKGRDDDYIDASPNNQHALFDMITTCNGTQHLWVEDCILEDLTFGVNSSPNFGSLTLHNNMWVNVGASGGDKDLHGVYAHGIVLDCRGNNVFWTYDYSQLPFVNGDRTQSQRMRACKGQMFKTRNAFSYVCGNSINNERGSYSNLVDSSNNGTNYVDGNVGNEGVNSAILGAYLQTFTDNHIHDFGTNDNTPTWTTNKLYRRLNTTWNRGDPGEWFLKMVIRVGQSLASSGDSIVAITGADPATGVSGQLTVNTTTNNFTKLPPSGLPVQILQFGVPMQPGTAVRFLFSGGGSIAPLVPGRRYFCIPIQIDTTVTQWAVATTLANAIAGTKIDLTGVTAGLVIIECVPGTMDIRENVEIGTTADSSLGGTLLGYGDDDLPYALNTKNSYKQASDMADQSVYNRNFALATPVAAAQLYEDGTGQIDYWDPT